MKSPIQSNKQEFEKWGGWEGVLGLGNIWGSSENKGVKNRLATITRIPKPFGEGALVDSGVTVIIGRFLFQTQHDTQPGLGTQPRYKALGDLGAENTVINIGRVRLSPR